MDLLVYISKYRLMIEAEILQSSIECSKVTFLCTLELALNLFFNLPFIISTIQRFIVVILDSFASEVP